MVSIPGRWKTDGGNQGISTVIWQAKYLHVSTFEKGDHVNRSVMMSRHIWPSARYCIYHFYISKHTRVPTTSHNQLDLSASPGVTYTTHNAPLPIMHYYANDVGCVAGQFGVRCESGHPGNANQIIHLSECHQIPDGLPRYINRSLSFHKYSIDQHYVNNN